MKKLKKGDKVAIVAPSGQIGDIEKIQDGLKYLQSLGLQPVFGKHLFSQYRYMAGHDKERADDINRAFADSQIKALFCVRAAAGASRILPYIDYENARRHKKVVIGFCDNAALQMALLKKAGVTSWNGFLLSYDFKKKTLDETINTSLQHLINNRPFTITSGQTIRHGICEGKLICSNLSVLTKLAGTPYFPNLTGKILLVEDVHERLHKIDLMFQQLRQQPHFQQLRGLILGQFTDCSGDEEDGTLDDCIHDFIADTNIPIIKNFAFGHTDSRYVLPMGAKIRLNADSCCLDILLDQR